jgi:glycogen synthase
MRVLHLTTEWPPVIYGGLGTAVSGLVTASARAGMTVGVLLVGETGLGEYGQPILADHTLTHQEEVIAKPGEVKIFHVSWIDAIETSAHLVEKWRPEVVHLHSFWLWPIASVIQERLGTPLVYTVHSLDRAEYELGQGPPECLTQWKVQEAAIRGADRVVALTGSERELLIQYCPEASDRIRIIGNGIDGCATVDRTMRHTGRSESLMVLYSGRFVERKGVGDLLAAIPLVLPRVPTARFVLIGGHRHCSQAEMEHWWLPPALYPFRSHIYFTGWLAPNDLDEWYRTADILVVPSRYEPFGMVILEGMLHGLPIVASAVGGPAEILENGRTGFLFPPRDVDALACAILQFLENPNLRRQIGTVAAKEVRKKWLWTHIVEKMWGVYQEAMQTRSAMSF